MNIARPLAGAVQRYQIERPPAFPAWVGSPDSFDAAIVRPVKRPSTPLNAWAFANASLAGGAGENDQRRFEVPTTPALPPIAIAYVRPAFTPTVTRLVFAVPLSSLAATAFNAPMASPS